MRSADHWDRCPALQQKRGGAAGATATVVHLNGTPDQATDRCCLLRERPPLLITGWAASSLEETTWGHLPFNRPDPGGLSMFTRSLSALAGMLLVAGTVALAPAVSPAWPPHPVRALPRA